MQIIHGSLAELARLRRGVHRHRVSSYDTSGANFDYWQFSPGQVQTIANIGGAGCIRHIWMTMASEDVHLFRKVVLRMWWDDEAEPSVEVPIGDFFGLGHGVVKNFWSLPLAMSPECGQGFNCYFPMPFASRARIEVSNKCSKELRLFFYIDFETYSSLDDEYGRFHAQWRRQNPTDGWSDPDWQGNAECLRETMEKPNLDGRGNYVVLEAHGRGHFVGYHLDIDVFSRQFRNWYGEGDDMIWIDQSPEEWPPRLHGTGTEDCFNMAWCPTEEYCSPYHGLILYSGTQEWPWGGKNSCYRYYIEDPIYFDEYIKYTIEHGHANNLTIDYCSTAYWYQIEPHLSFPPFPPVEARLPRESIGPDPGQLPAISGDI
jgi:hypothetical protein